MTQRYRVSWNLDYSQTQALARTSWLCLRQKQYGSIPDNKNKLDSSLNVSIMKYSYHPCSISSKSTCWNLGGRCFSGRTYLSPDCESTGGYTYHFSKLTGVAIALRQTYNPAGFFPRTWTHLFLTWSQRIVSLMTYFGHFLYFCPVCQSISHLQKYWMQRNTIFLQVPDLIAGNNGFQKLYNSLIVLQMNKECAQGIVGRC